MSKHRLLIVLSVLAVVSALAACGNAGTPSDATASEETTAVPAAALTWSADSDCSVCHGAEAESAGNPLCLASAHATLGCTDCHGDTAGLQNAHAGLTYADVQGTSKLSTTSVARDACLACHEGDYLPETTAGVTALTDMNGTTINPHALPVSDSHADIMCGDCHAMHTETPVTETAPAVCISCHHAKVYECGTCH